MNLNLKENKRGSLITPYKAWESVKETSFCLEKLNLTHARQRLKPK